MSLPLSIPQREIGKTGVKTSAVGLGCMSLRLDVTFGIQQVSRALSVVYVCITTNSLASTVDIYGADGYSERIISKVIKDRRKDVFLATKFAFDISTGRVNGSPEYIAKACARSLERLGTDYIDLYYMHRMDPTTPIEESVRAMAKLVEEGKVKYLGLSECSAETLRRAHKVHPITAVQIEYSPWTLDIETNEVLKTCRELGISIVAYSPLGRGFLTGNYRSIDDLEENDWRRTNPRFQGENFKKNLELADSIKEVAEKKGVTAAQVTLAWLLAQGDDIFVIPGTRKEKYLVDNAASGSLQLSKDDLNQIRTLSEAFQPSGERYDERGMKMLNH
ncbi:hypothetical protein INT44_006980 [Umbelopsis vinacea]|uniref:NADP-dependent oxidoreductase domain-containing protein n=1 Tax=Umbelopsis vinacea TaxID=44442 RepID=A0A8H7PFI5_9FUNG|nr:hypothetical protein INT44_006980 [Umbelopsis vinacea]